MTIWADFLTDSAALYAIYGDELPALSQIDLHEILLHRDGARVSFRFDLPDFPKAPPKKWKESGFNRVQLKLLVVGIRDVSIKGWPPEGNCNFVIFSNGQSISLKVEDGGLSVHLDADYLCLDGVSAYRSERGTDLFSAASEVGQ